MISLTDYIKINEDNEDQIAKLKSDVKFIIWDEEGNQQDFSDNPQYQKIEYKYKDRSQNIEIDFLLGKTKNSWKLWVGKVGAVNYADKPYKDLEVFGFTDAILKAIDIVVDFIEKVKQDKYNYVQYYINF